jgi:hypothetical protein
MAHQPCQEIETNVTTDVLIWQHRRGEMGFQLAIVYLDILFEKSEGSL